MNALLKLALKAALADPAVKAGIVNGAADLVKKEPALAPYEPVIVPLLEPALALAISKLLG